MLTDKEKEALELTSRLNHLMKYDIIEEGPGYQSDYGEFVYKIHDIQRLIMSQSAGREYPLEYRLLGKSLTGK